MSAPTNLIIPHLPISLKVVISVLPFYAQNMLAKVYSAIPYGYDGHLVEIEGDSSRGLPSFNIVGMANKTISEAKDRVKSALNNSGFTFPTKKITINLAPAELQKDGTFLDLPIAIAILLLSRQLLPENIQNYFFVGELSLDGSLRPVRGIINILEAARLAGFSSVFLPLDNLKEAQLVTNLELLPAKNLTEIFLHLKSQVPIQIPTNIKSLKNNFHQKLNPSNFPSLDQIQGQAFAKRALTIAIAGHHNLLFSGPPGTGKTLLARAGAGLLPEPSSGELLEITKIHSLTSSFSSIIKSRPFRHPHHTSSLISLIGGGNPIIPGEISLAHHGILFLDELPEFPRSLIEALRQPLEDHLISISRAHQKAIFPSNFILIATMNPCPCGYFNDPDHNCTCTPNQINNYLKKLSGPLLDRIDLQITLPKIPTKDLLLKQPKNHQNNTVKNSINSAIALQKTRYSSNKKYNGDLSSTEIQTYLKLTAKASKLLSLAADRLKLSTRAYFKTIKIAQTIADLDQKPLIDTPQISEALSYRLNLNLP